MIQTAAAQGVTFEDTQSSGDITYHIASPDNTMSAIHPTDYMGKKKFFGLLALLRPSQKKKQTGRREPHAQHHNQAIAAEWIGNVNSDAPLCTSSPVGRSGQSRRRSYRNELILEDLSVGYVRSAPRVHTLTGGPPTMRKCIFALKQCQWSQFSIQGSGYNQRRETDRHTHTHTHTERERERERERYWAHMAGSVPGLYC